MQLAEILEAYKGLPADQQALVAKDALEATKGLKWIPNPGPQTEAYFSEADCLLYGGEPGGGKDISVDTPIPTPHGWQTLAEIMVGDQVFDDRGMQCKVIAKSEVFNNPAFRIVFSDGAEIVAGPAHQWVTSTRAERSRALKCTDQWRESRRSKRPSRASGSKSPAFTASISLRNSALAKSRDLSLSSIRETREIAQTLRGCDGRLNHSIQVAGGLELPDAPLLIEPYVLGAWLGDGGSSAGQISGIDEEIFEQVANGGYAITHHAGRYSRGVIGLQKQLRQLSVFGNKHIPLAYLRASKAQRLALLQGLMDTDGHCDQRGQCEIQLTRKTLVDGVLELIHSLGIKAQMHEGRAKLYGRDISAKWRIKFLTDLPAFRLPRKLIRQKRAGFRGTHDVRYIVAANPIEAEPTQCIQVDSPSRMYLCGRAMVPTHNSQLILGLAFNCHQRSLIMRRQYGDLDRLVEDALKIHGSRNGFNGSPPPKLRVSESQIIDFAAAHRVGDEQGQMGKGRDFLGIDEATHFAESQIRFVMGWNRTDTHGQRVRTVLATNPPLTAEGLWVNTMFAPWLDPTYPNPAKPGELRWVISDDEGKDEWVSGPNDTRMNVRGKVIRPTSRTYIPAKVSDNPYYAATDYERQLDAMPEPYRSLLMGGFKTTFRDAENQVIPTAWIKLAQERWKSKPPEGVPMCAMGVDASGGGDDPMVIAPRHDGWFAKLIVIPGKEIPVDRIGPYCAGIVVSHRRNDALVVIDMGGGYGGSMHDHLKGNSVEVQQYKGAEGTTRRSRDGKLKFHRVRSAAYWSLREALDPAQEGGSPIALPDDPELVADLAAATFEPTPNGIQVEPKDQVCARLGRSTDKGDAVVMSWWAGPKMATHYHEWRADQRTSSRVRNPQVNFGSRRK